MPRWVPGALIVSGSVGVLSGIFLITQTAAGFWTLALGLVSVFLGLRLRRHPFVLKSEGYRAVAALVFLAVALFLFYSAIADVRSGDPGAAIVSVVVALAALYLPLGYTAGLIAEGRIRSGKGGSISRWAAETWRRGGNSGKGSQR